MAGYKPIKWEERDSWIAVYDILGFKNIIKETDDELNRMILTERLNALFCGIDEEIRDIKEYTNDELKLDYIVFSDTIVMLAPDLGGRTFAWFESAASSLITRAINEDLPLQGAISAGKSYTEKGHPMFLGSAFLEAYEYCDAQDWIGLLITPSATKEMGNHGLIPTHLHYRRHDIPWRKNKPPENFEEENTYAYQFEQGGSNSRNQIATKLEQLQQHAPESAKRKYSHSISFIDQHHVSIDTKSNYSSQPRKEPNVNTPK